jgi:tetratricopeptide (TPR) repeat protein
LLVFVATGFTPRAGAEAGQLRDNQTGQEINGSNGSLSPSFGETGIYREPNSRRGPDSEGSFVSVTSYAAPKVAKKEYGAAVGAMWGREWAKAEPHLKKAVALYPSYAAAWYRLGLCYQFENRPTEARDAYRRALDAEPKYPDVHYILATLELAGQHWDAVVENTDKVVALDPTGFPGAYYMNAMANLRLHNLDLAEKSAREGLGVDTRHRLPKLEQILALALAQGKSYAEAGEHLRAYLKLERDPSEIELARRQLAVVEREAGR